MAAIATNREEKEMSNTEVKHHFNVMAMDVIALCAEARELQLSGAAGWREVIAKPLPHTSVAFKNDK